MPTLGDAAETWGLSYRGDPHLTLDRLAPISQAGVGDLSFIAQKKFAKSLASSQATAVICPEAWVGDFSGAVLFSDDPYADFARATRLFDNRPASSERVDGSAVISETAQLGANVTIDAGAVIADGARIGDNAWVGPNVWIGKIMHNSAKLCNNFFGQTSSL